MLAVIRKKENRVWIYFCGAQRRERFIRRDEGDPELAAALRQDAEGEWD